jgi:hypothetical protein
MAGMIRMMRVGGELGKKKMKTRQRYFAVPGTTVNIKEEQFSEQSTLGKKEKTGSKHKEEQKN